MYSFLKKHKEIRWDKNIPHESCACEVCENTKLFVRGFNSVLPQSQRLPKDESNLADLFTYAELNVSFQKSHDDIDSTSNSDDSSDTSYLADSPISTFKYYKWITIDSKIQKFPFEIDMLRKYHLYIQNEQ